jgi:hypothetical protein
MNGQIELKLWLTRGEASSLHETLNQQMEILHKLEDRDRGEVREAALGTMAAIIPIVLALGSALKAPTPAGTFALLQRHRDPIEPVIRRPQSSISARRA